MCADNYKYLCSVNYENELLAALVPEGSVSPGDLVALNIGIMGNVERSVFVDTNSEEFQILSDLAHVHEVVEIYRKCWSAKEDRNGDS